LGGDLIAILDFFGSDRPSSRPGFGIEANFLWPWPCPKVQALALRAALITTQDGKAR